MTFERFKAPPVADIVFYTFVLPLISTLFISLFTNYLFGWKISIPTSISFTTIVFEWRKEVLNGYFGRDRKTKTSYSGDVIFPLQFLLIILLLSFIKAPLYVYLSIFFIPTTVSLAMTMSDRGCSNGVMAISLVGMVGCVMGLWWALILLLSQ